MLAGNGAHETGANMATRLDHAKAEAEQAGVSVEAYLLMRILEKLEQIEEEETDRAASVFSGMGQAAAEARSRSEARAKRR